jgi:deoxycytidine triphosphate deaminase/intein/homing endonuclease
VILSDRSIREELDAGGIVIDPLDEGCIQPSSVDLHVDRFFRVFRNDTTPFIDPKRAQEDLTELVEVADGGAFILHPGEFVLGSTLERVALGADLVARLEGKSSLGRLGLLIHSSLPASEKVIVLANGSLQPMRIDEVVRRRLDASVVGFDPETFEIGYHRVTGWYEGPPDRIFEVHLASGRRVRVTAGHNFFTLDSEGRLSKARTGELRRGARVAIPARIPDPAGPPMTITLSDLIPEDHRRRITCSGPTVAGAFATRDDEIRALFGAAAIRHASYYRERSQLPVSIADQIPGLVESLGADDRLAFRGSRHRLACALAVDRDLAWLLGIYVAEGSRRATQFTISNTDDAILDRAARIVRGYGIPVSRGRGAITGCCSLFSLFLEWIGTGPGAHNKRIPPLAFGWPRPQLEALLEGLVDGDGSHEETRTSIWTCSDGLASDVLLLAERLGLRAGSSLRRRGKSRLWQIYMPVREHKLLTSVPLPDRLLVEIRTEAGLSQASASRLAGYRHPTDLCNLERRSGRDAVRLATLRRLRAAYARRRACAQPLRRLDRLVDGDLLWDRVTAVTDTGVVEPVFDLEVRPDGRRVENFLAGAGGVFVSNTAGFVDAGWDGHLTLELSNVANLPIAIYPGMKIGQISFLRMTTEAEVPYGSDTTASKYKGQQGPTPSRYYLNFPEDERE